VTTDEQQPQARLKGRGQGDNASQRIWAQPQAVDHPPGFKNRRISNTVEKSFFVAITGFIYFIFALAGFLSFTCF
jgi:hypothetical protein